MARQDFSFDPPTFDQFYNRLYPKLVAWIFSRGVPSAEAEDMAQNIMLAFFRECQERPSAITHAVGWCYQRAEWRLMDWKTDHLQGRVQSLTVETDAGETAEIDLPARAPDPVTVLRAHQWVDRCYEPFWELLELRAGSYREVVRAILQMVEERIPYDRVEQASNAAIKVLRFVEGRQLVFSGKKKDDEKRDSQDVQTLADRLRMSTGAVRVALNRLQPVWLDCESELVRSQRSA